MLGLLTSDKVQLLIALFALRVAVPEKKAWEDNLDQLENLIQRRLVSGTRFLSSHPGSATS